MSLVENLALCHSTFKKLVRDNFSEVHALKVLKQFQYWINGGEREFEVDLLNTLSSVMVSSLDDFFRVSNEYGNISEMKIGSFGYVLTLLVLYCRYLVRAKDGNIKHTQTSNLYNIFFFLFRCERIESWATLKFTMYTSIPSCPRH